MVKFCTARFSALILAGCTQLTMAGEIDFSRLLNAHTTPEDWLMPNGTYRSWNYSALEQINSDNAATLQVAWQHTPSAARHGVQSVPLVADGVLYYITASGEAWALNASDGLPLWRYPGATAATQLGDVRGLALGYGKVMFGNASGDVIALDMRSGKLLWRSALIDTKLSRYRLGVPLVVKDKLIIGADSGAVADCCGPIFALNVHTGAKLWQFDTVAPEAATRATWSNDSWKAGGGGAWRSASYDYENNTLWIGTASPTPRWDAAIDPAASENLRVTTANTTNAGGARPTSVRAGNNLYTSSVLVLNADSGKLVSHFQEMPHDVWGFDAAGGENIIFERDGKRYAMHPNKSGFVYVFDRNQGRAQLANVWRMSKFSNFVHSVDHVSGALVGRREPTLGKHVNMCPSLDGALGPATGALSGRTGMYYKSTREWCHDIELTSLATEQSGQAAALSVKWRLAHPPAKPDATGAPRAFGHVSGRDPLSGSVMWEREYAQPPSGNLLATAGNVLFVSHANGTLEALDAKSGRSLWTHQNGLAHQAGAITFSVAGKQYVAAVTGWGAEAAASYATLWGEPFSSMPTDAGQLIVFSLP